MYESCFARHYDALTADVDYSLWADYYVGLFHRYGVAPSLVLDLACGSGSISCELASRGYDVIGVDASEEMLSVAQAKAASAGLSPAFICQRMEELDLYGSVQAAVCALDSVNYIPSVSRLNEAFSRIGTFIEKGGLFIFDVNTEHRFRKLSGRDFVREADGIFCAWQASFNRGRRLARYEINLFEEHDGLYERFSERHVERAHTLGELDAALALGGMERVGLFGELSSSAPSEKEERVFIAARKTL